ncbi:hypothetical protein ABZX30_29875 [Streptomyces sp. NPDC004542]|uniref:hypothetical protein n=1 Tax=Streptomyces sp. NPDC004542 TaxID=3154281 RepID=UPI0033AD6C44
MAKVVLNPAVVAEWLDQLLATGKAVMNDDGTVTIHLTPEETQQIKALVAELKAARSEIPEEES